MSLVNVSDPRHLGVTISQTKSNMGMANMPQGNMGLANIADPRYLELTFSQTQTNMVW